jgi:hypothetical protein
MSGERVVNTYGWHDQEVVGAGLPDKRLARRLRCLLDQMSASPGHPAPAACGDWAATKAAYRFFDNPRVTEHGVLAGHFAATAARVAASEGPIVECRRELTRVCHADLTRVLGMRRFLIPSGGLWFPFAMGLGCGAVPEAEAVVAVSGLVAYLCRSDRSFRLLDVRKPGGFCLPTPNACGAGYRSR